MAATAYAKGYQYEGSTRRATITHVDEEVFQWVKARAIEADRTLASEIRHIVNQAKAQT